MQVFKIGKNKMIACNDYLIITILFTAGITLIVAGIFLLIARYFILKKCDRDMEKNNKLIEKISSGAGGDFILREIPNSEAEDLVLRFIDSSSVTEVQNEFGDTVLQVLPIGLNELRDFPVSEDDDRIIDDDGVEFKSSGATIIDLAVKEAIKKQKEKELPV